LDMDMDGWAKPWATRILVSSGNLEGGRKVGGRWVEGGWKVGGRWVEGGWKVGDPERKSPEQRGAW
jgi:hypothetical protein